MRTRRLSPAEVEAAHAIVAACGKALAALGHRNWDPPIALDKMRADATTGEVWIVEEEGVEVATFTLDTTPPKPWPREIFDPRVSALYVNRLAVVPSRRFYERLGYVERGDWDGGDVPLTCFEKELT